MCRVVIQVNAMAKDKASYKSDTAFLLKNSSHKYYWERHFDFASRFAKTPDAALTHRPRTTGVCLFRVSTVYL
jgi:hypothetical protein